jgi:hypothetical protein
MSTILSILVLTFSVGTSASETQIARPALLDDGFILKGIEGKLTGSDSNDTWFFELLSDVTDGNVVLKAETRLKLLPSATLENMIADANERSANRYMIEEGVITKYKGKNFIFPNYFSPLRAEPAPKIPPEKEKKQPQLPRNSPVENKDQQPAINDSNDLLTIPAEIVEMLKAAKATETAKAQRSTAGKKIQNEKINPTAEETASISARNYRRNINTVFIDRTALLVKQENDGFIFVLDAFGRNTPQVSLRLLPCEMLELTENRQAAVPEPVRFKVAGIMTKYKGNNYLLLQKATQIYSYGNFGR